MNEQLALLYELQRIDTQVQADKTELDELDDGSQTEQLLAQQEECLAQMQQDLSNTKAELHDKELELQGTENDREVKWNQCYGGQVSDPKELQALAQKIAELDRRKDDLEGKILRLMEEVEAQQQQTTAQSAEVEELRDDLRRIQQHYSTRTEYLTNELHDLRQRREQLLPQISASLLQQYVRICQKSSNLAVVAVVNGACSGCRTSVPSNSITRLESTAEVVKCESCHRILVIPE